MLENDDQLMELWRDFLAQWPITRLENMTIEEYSQAGNPNTFTQWIESKLDRLGSIWGGSSFKFGIYSRDNRDVKEDEEKGRKYSNEYGWYRKYGNTPTDAFETVKKLIIEIAHAAASGDLRKVEETDLGLAYKWKIAFHYQDISRPKIAAVFKKEMFHAFLGPSCNSLRTMLELQSEAIRHKDPGESILDFSRRVWTSGQSKFRIWKISHGNTISQIDRNRYLEDRIITLHKDTRKGQSSAFGAQTDEFGKALLIGDLFYLCHGNEEGAVLIGKVTSNPLQSTINPDWIERKYEVIAKSIHSKPYDGPKKGWTPNYNSTLALVDPKDANDFEELILRPYFNMGLDSLGIEATNPTQSIKTDNQDDSDSRYFWLNANPAQWDPREIAVGEVQTYTLYNENRRPRRIFRNFCDANEGDKIIIYATSPVRKVISKGEIVRRVSNPEDFEARLAFRIDEHFVDGLSRDELITNLGLGDCEALKGNGQGSLFRLTKSEYMTIIENIAEQPKDSFDEADLKNAISVEEAHKDVYMSRHEFDEIIEALRLKKNVIIQGPPGCGKSFLARRLAMALTADKTLSRMTWVQFHQSYSYEDFIRGYKPTPTGGFIIRDGIFLRACQKAAVVPGLHVFIVDEMNRGNINKVFGEMLYLLESDKRNPENSISLAYTLETDINEKFWIPDNLCILGLINTADRSLVAMDHAFRRRFAFFDFPPRFSHENFQSRLTEAGFSRERVEQIITAVKEVNEAIAGRSDLGPGFEIGHSYFCPTNLPLPDPERWLQNVINHEVGPLIKEYFVDDESKASILIERLIKA